MNDTPTADGKVLLHFTRSLDGFVAEPIYEMDWMMTGFSNRPGVLDESQRVLSAARKERNE